MRCPNDLELQSYFDGEQELHKVNQLTKHISQCAICQDKLAAFSGVVTLLKVGFPDLSTPRVLSSPGKVTHLSRLTFSGEFNIFKKSLTVAAAVIIIVGALSGTWYYKATQQSELSPEAEIMDQYMTIYNEDVTGILK